jgi:DNA-binding MarR family transcriptional regulator
MRRTISDSEYAALAEMRYRIRQFLRGSDDAAEKAGLEPQQYQMLLAIRALPGEGEAIIGQLADRLLIRHHSAVGLIDRLEAHGYVRRDRSLGDQRQVSVILLPRGQRALEQVVGRRLHELRGSGHALVAAINTILKHAQVTRSRRKTSYKSAQKDKNGPEPRYRSTRPLAKF